MVSEKKNPSPRGSYGEKRPAVGAPIVAACGIVLAACMTFGNPVLWAPNDQVQPRVNQTGDPSGTAPSTNTPQEKLEDGTVLVSEYKASSQSDDLGRVNNIELAVAALNETVIQPGEVFSFNGITGDTENDERYEVAPTVYGNEIAYARGGGICQVSTALYVAALEADMEIVERHPHSMVVDYAPIGLDATLVYGIMDLRLKNTTDEPMKIVAASEGQTVTIKIYGKELKEGLSVVATSKIIERRDASGQQQDIEEGTTPSEDSYYVVESHRIYYQNGVKANSEYLGTDTYEAKKESVVMLAEGGFSPTK